LGPVNHDSEAGKEVGLAHIVAEGGVCGVELREVPVVERQSGRERQPKVFASGNSYAFGEERGSFGIFFDSYLLVMQGNTRGSTKVSERGMTAGPQRLWCTIEAYPLPPCDDLYFTPARYQARRVVERGRIGVVVGVRDGLLSDCGGRKRHQGGCDGCF